MKRLIQSEAVLGISNLTPKRTGLSVQIWSEHSGVTRNRPDSSPRVKVGTNEGSVSISIESSPKVLAPKSWRSKFKESLLDSILEGVAYVGRNYDLFLKHYNDTSDSFDDDDLHDALRARGEYK